MEIKETAIKNFLKERGIDESDYTWEKYYNLYISGIKNDNIRFWRRQNRIAYKNNQLPKDKIIKLKKINFQFNQEDSNQIWERNFELYKKGIRDNHLYYWVYKNRKMYKEGNLSPFKLKKLKSIKFDFNKKDK